MVHNPRVAILGLHLEANAFSPPTTEQDFKRLCWAEGLAISDMARSASSLPSEVPGFYARMDAVGSWTPVPIIVVAAPPGGPIEQLVFEKFLDVAAAGLRAALPVDAVYIPSHGASSATGDPDSDGTVATLTRQIVGPNVPIVVTHDLHCNVSERMVGAIDALVTYRTNPHVDMRARAAEAADLLREMLAGTRMTSAFIHLPLVAPSVTLLTAAGPYADLIHCAETLIQAPSQGPVAAVSVAGGFAHSDLPKCGMTVTVTTRHDAPLARRVALDLARRAWADRNRYVSHLLSVDDAVRMAGSAAAPMILADVADNPGGGGRGNTTDILAAAYQARLSGAVFGIFIEPGAAAEAHRLGEGKSFRAVFNPLRESGSEDFAVGVKVLKLTDGRGVGRRGILAGRAFNLGPSALLELDDSGVRVVVGSLRNQLSEPRMLEMHGIDVSEVRCLVVKSRGHFRAGFDEWFAPEAIHEVDASGLASPNFARVSFQHLARPVAPMDADAVWNGN
ncbi:MAG: M81 family peptidase [Candidimonas sp.]|nr:MAG: M81 family peptidase [Candidimonas sp.]